MNGVLKMNRKRHSVWVAAVGLLALALISAAAAYGVYGHAFTSEQVRGQARVAEKLHRAHVRVTQQISTAKQSPAYQRNVQSSSGLLQVILNRYGGTRVTEASVGAPPATAYDTDEPGVTAPVDPANLWAYLKVTASKDAPSIDRALWEGGLVVGALRDEIARANPGASLFGASISVVDSNGREIYHGAVVYRRPTNEPRRDDSPGNVIAEVRSHAAKQGLTIKSIRLLGPLGHAPVIVASTNDPAGFVARADGIVTGLFDIPRAFDGFFLEVQDVSGSPF
jgi:hypothetical protein